MVILGGQLAAICHQAAPGYWDTKDVAYQAGFWLAAALGIIGISASLFSGLKSHNRMMREIGQRRQPQAAADLLLPVTELEGNVLLANQLLIERDRFSELILQAAEDDAHDLKSPLALIKVAHRRIRRAAATDATKVLAALAVADDATEHLLAAIEAHRTLLEQIATLGAAPRNDLSLTLAVAEVRCSLLSSVERKKIRLVFCRKVELRLWTNGCLLNMLLTDLLTNAVEASLEGGEILIASRLEDSDAVIEVSDGGSGIASDDPNLLFLRAPLGAGTATRTCPSRRRYFVTKQSIDLLGGAFTIVNQPSGRVLATVRLPQYRG